MSYVSPYSICIAEERCFAKCILINLSFTLRAQVYHVCIFSSDSSYTFRVDDFIGGPYNRAHSMTSCHLHGAEVFFFLI